MANYVSISHREMQDFMEALGFRELTVEERSGRYATGKLRVVRERVFERPLGEGVIRVYSSVVGPDSRRKGRDAIRVQYWVDGKKVYGTQRVHRVVNWRRNLLQRIYELDDLVSKGALRRVPRDSTGQPMVVRTAKKTGKKFWGSSNYPRNQETRRFGAETPWPIKIRQEKYWPPSKLLRIWVSPEESGKDYGYFRYERVPLTPIEMENNLANFCEVCGVGNSGFTTERGSGAGSGGGLGDIGTFGPDGEKESFWICKNCHMDLEDAWFYLFGRKKSFKSEVDKEISYFCPYCGDGDIEYLDRFEDGYITVGCNTCGSNWHEVWKFMGLELEYGREGWEAEMTATEDKEIKEKYEDYWFYLVARNPAGNNYHVSPLNLFQGSTGYVVESEKGVEHLVEQIAFLFDNLGDAPTPYAIDIFTQRPFSEGRPQMVGVIKYGKIEYSHPYEDLSKLLNRRVDLIRSAESELNPQTEDVRTWIRKGQSVYWIDPDEDNPQNRRDWKIYEGWEEHYGDTMPDTDEIIWLYTPDGSETEAVLHELRPRNRWTGYSGSRCQFCGRTQMDLALVGDQLKTDMRPAYLEDGEPMSVGKTISCGECFENIPDKIWVHHALYDESFWDGE
jgi:ssDNA-binding Zn-finger/Zn-ribbon topoisomerase 1